MPLIKSKLIHLLRLPCIWVGFHRRWDGKVNVTFGEKKLDWTKVNFVAVRIVIYICFLSNFLFLWSFNTCFNFNGNSTQIYKWRMLRSNGCQRWALDLNIQKLEKGFSITKDHDIVGSINPDRRNWTSNIHGNPNHSKCNYKKVYFITQSQLHIYLYSEKEVISKGSITFLLPSLYSFISHPLHYQDPLPPLPLPLWSCKVAFRTLSINEENNKERNIHIC